MASSPLDHLGRALAGALSGLAAVGDEARRRVDGARDAVAGAVANAQQKQSAAMVATQQRRRATRRPVGVAVRLFRSLSIVAMESGCMNFGPRRGVAIEARVLRRRFGARMMAADRCRRHRRPPLLSLSHASRFPLLLFLLLVHTRAKTQSMTMHQQQQQQQEIVPVSTADLKNARWGPALSDLAASSTAEELARAANPPPGPPDLLLRLSSVPVYAVVNKKDEFVLVTGGARAKDGSVVEKELGLLFMSEAGARALADKVIKEAGGGGGKGGKKIAKGDVMVARTTLDRVYSLAAAAVRPAGAEDVIFRFVPSAREVSRAVALVREGVAAAAASPSSSSSSSSAAAEDAVPGFAGVPVFQAAGLSVSSDARRYTPLFLDSADLDEAVRGAAAARDAAAAAAEADDSARALRAAKDKLEATPEKDQKRHRQAEEAVEQALARAAAAGERGIVEGAGGPAPPVEVGCLEAVLAEMAGERSLEGGPWSQAMIVPPGALAARAAAAAAAAKKKKK